jgi:NADP-dependent 3-hydroxy acid dehydrogenase YdfG
MPGNEMAGATALLTGASRGFGRDIASALSKAGAQVVGVAREYGALEEVRAGLGESFTPVPAGAADPEAAGARTASAVGWPGNDRSRGRP